MNTIFALVDCNNFFVSCERIFRPGLEGRPVVVLSSNDGCVVARSNEAKDAGIPMGAPAFQWRQAFRDNDVVCFSANFELYGNISRRIISVLRAVTPRTEVYSVDESFLDLSELSISNYTAWGRELRRRVWQTAGVPVSVGVAPAKTLAKLAADSAKKDRAGEGVLDLAISPGSREGHLAQFPVEDVWGVGRRLAPKLHAEGIHTALGLSHLRPRHARQLMGLTGMRMVQELNGLSCHTLTPVDNPHKTIMCSRTFGEDTADYDVLEAAVTTLTSKAAFRLRQEGQLATRASLFIATSKYKPGYQAWYEEVTLAMPSYDGARIAGMLLAALAAIYNPRQQYHRAGVTLYGFVPADYLQTDLTGEVRPDEYDASRARMAAVDAINARFGSGHIRYAAECLTASWQPKHNIRSPRYLSCWCELPEAHIS